MSVCITVIIFNTDIEAMGNFKEIDQLTPDLEEALDWVTGLTWQGYTLCSVTLQYGNRCETNLPLSLFDGQLFSPALTRLRQEWSAILSTD